MRKRILLLLTTIILSLFVSSAAVAEANLVAPFLQESPEAALTARIAEMLDLNFLPADKTAKISNVRIESINRMLSEPETFLCDTQAALLVALQGYTNEDLRSAMKPVCRIARSPLYLVMDAESAKNIGIIDGSSFLAYLAENEYDDHLVLARHVEADPSDRAAAFLSDELPLLTDIFWPDNIPDMLKCGDIALAVYTEAELNAASSEDLLILFALGSERTGTYPEIPSVTEAGLIACPEPALYLMARSGENESLLDKMAQKICENPLITDCLSAGYVFDPLSGDSLSEEISAIFTDYKSYMTAEGLFFYEQ